MHDRRALTLGDLLEQTDLGLTVVGGRPDDHLRQVLGAHTVEVPRPGPWVDRDWLVLTSGVQLQGDERAMAGFVEELAAAGVAALAFGLEPVYAEIPPALLAAADAVGLPVIAVPPRVPFREITERVVRASLNEDVRVSQRLAAMQRYLMDAIGDERPQRTTIERLASLVQGRVALLTREGRVDIATAAVPGDELWAEIAPRPRTTLELLCEDEPWVAVPVLDREGEVRRWLVASVPNERTLPLAKAAVQAAAPLLSAVDRLERARRTEHRALRSVVLTRLVDGDADPVVVAQLRELGFASEPPGTLIAIAETGETEAERRAALAVAEEGLDQAGLCFVAGLRRELVVVLVQGDAEAIARFAETLAVTLSAALVGVGEAHAIPDGVTRSFREAELAVEHARGGDAPAVTWFKDLGAPTAILAEVPLAPVRDRARPLLLAMGRQPGSIETLRSYFDHDLNITATAADLHLHPNSLRYRLSRIEDIVGASLRDPGTIAALYLALRASREA